jgi:hypothetical protein
MGNQFTLIDEGEDIKILILGSGSGGKTGKDLLLN